MMLSVCGVHFTYNSHPLLQNIDFGLERGELLAILGPNGVGKTTLLKCMNAILRPASGAILVEERDILSLSPSDIARDIGYVSQKNEASRLTVFDAACSIFLPVATSPVSEIMSTPLWVTSAFPTVSPRPVMILTTPLGSSSASMCANLSAVSGVCSAGLKTTVLP